MHLKDCLQIYFYINFENLHTKPNIYIYFLNSLCQVSCILDKKKFIVLSWKNTLNMSKTGFRDSVNIEERS